MPPFTLEQRVTKLENQMSDLHKEISVNTAITVEVREILNTAKGAFKFFSWAGDLLKWGAGIVAALLAVWVASKDVWHK